MAGEWISVDCNLHEKQEIHELIEITSQGIEVCVYRVYRLFAWFQLHSADGTAKATPARLASMIVGDADFWRAVERVGWLSFDSDAGTVTISGWEKRFSKAAKARILSAARMKKMRDADVTQQRNKNVTREEDKREQIPPPPREASPQEADAPPAPLSDGWQTLLAAWNAASAEGQRWRSPNPPANTAQRLAEQGWLDRALTAIARLPRCRFFATPVPLQQFVGPGFVDRLLGGQYDNAPKQLGDSIDKPQPKAWSGDDAARLEATRRRMVQQLRTEEA
jgi:hypothetical protein